MLQEYTEQWNESFQKERKYLENVLGKNLISVHHIGSTAIRDICAKPQIDIAVEVHNLKGAKILQEYGYIFKGEFNIPFRFFFSKNEPQINLHVMLEGNHELDNFISFRDYLNSHKDECKIYADVKQNNKHLFREKTENSIFNKYTLSKDEVIRGIIKRSGFDKICMRKVAHYLDFNYEKQVAEKNNLKINEDAIRCVLYKGAEIIGYALGKDKNVIFIEANEKYEEFLSYFLNYLSFLNTK